MGTRKRMHQLLAAVAVMTGVVAAMALPIPPATSGTVAAADISTAIGDAPDPVNAGNNVTYTVRVTNAGPDTATHVSMQDTPPGTSVVAVVPLDGFSCDPPSSTVDCSIGSLAPGASASVEITVKAPPVAEGSTIITDQASATADQSDPAPGNNSGHENTTVRQRSSSRSVGSIPPQGGSINDDVGAPGPDAADFTVVRMVFPSGPGGTALVAEEACAPPYSPCIGNVAHLKPPPGYDKITVILLQDSSVDPGKPLDRIHVYYQKHKTQTPRRLRPCDRTNPVANCVLGSRRTGQGFLRFRALIKSDPRLHLR